MGLITFGQLQERMQKARALAKRRTFQGLQISIETRKGAYRHWKDRTGRSGKVLMPWDYGYIRGSEGADGEHVDCYIGPNENATHAYVIDQKSPPDFMEFDEQKCMLGFDSEAAAKAAYHQAYDNPRFFGAIRTVPMADFKKQVLATTSHQPLVLSLSAKRYLRVPCQVCGADVGEECQGTAPHNSRWPELPGERPGTPLTVRVAKMQARLSEPVTKATLPASLLKSGVDKPPAGFSQIPSSRHGGYHKLVGGRWIYWYPTMGSAPHPQSGRPTPAPAEVSDEDFAGGHFDKVPAHWHYVRSSDGTVRPWTRGGIDPQSKHPVKIAGRDARLYQIVVPEHEHGWAKLRDVNSGEELIAQHERIHPVEHARAAPAKKPMPKPEGKPAEPPKGDGAPTGWAAGPGERIPVYRDSTAKQGTALHRVEGGYYPRKVRRVFQTDADGVARKVESQVLAMPEGDKVQLLGEMKQVIRRAANRARERLGVQKTEAVMADLNAAALEGTLHAIDNYRGGYSFKASCASYAEQHARLQAAREFAGGLGMGAREQRLLPGFLAARAEADTQAGGNADADAVARSWRLRKRDRHPGMAEGGDQPVPLNRYSLRAGEFVAGTDKPGRIELAQQYMSFVDGQRGHVDFGEDVLFPGAGVGYGLGATPMVEHERDVTKALEDVKQFDVVIGRASYRLDGADLLRRKLGIGREPQSDLAISKELQVHRLTSKGELQKLSPRAVYEIVARAAQHALDSLRGKLSDDTQRLVDQAKQRLKPPPEPSRGPTVFQRIEADSRKVSREDVKAWRAEQRLSLRQHAAQARARGEGERAQAFDRAAERISTIGTREARRHIAEMRVMLAPRSREWFRTAIPMPIDFQDPRNVYGSAVITLTDPATGAQRKVRVRTVRDLFEGDAAYKSDAVIEQPDIGVVKLVALRPRLAQTLWGSDDPLAFAPTAERAEVLDAMGL